MSEKNAQWAQLALAVVLGLSLVGCNTPQKPDPFGPWQGPGRDPRGGGQPKNPPHGASRFYIGPDQQLYFYDGGSGKTYRYNAATGVWVEVSNPPGPGSAYPEPITPVPGGVVQMPTGEVIAMPGAFFRQDWGLLPDENGQYQPLMWFENYAPIGFTALSADDTLDFYMMTETNWVLATDVDPNLATAIGENNIYDWRIDLNDGLAPVGEIMLHNVSVRNLAAFAIGTGFTTVTYTTPEGTWTAQINQSANSVIIAWNGVPWQTISLN